MYKDGERGRIQIRRKELIALIFIIFSEILYIVLNMQYLSVLYRDELKNGLKENCEIVSKLVKRYDEEYYQDIFKSLDVRINVISMEGKVLYDSTRFKNENLLENHKNRKEIQKLKDGKIGFDIHKSSISGKRMVYYATLGKDKTNREIIIRVSREYSGTEKRLREILCIEILFFVLLDIIIHLFYKNYLKRDLYRKISIIEDYLKEQKDGNIFYFDRDPILLNLWEIVQKWQNINLKNIENLNREKRILNQIIHSINSSICLFDGELNLITKNDCFEYLYENGKKNYLELIKDIEVIEIFKKGLDENQDTDVYISRLNKYFHINTKFLESDRRYLLHIKNITKSKRMVMAQKEFISNISHELKTPLTNIKGYVIALEDAPELLRKQFLETIKGNVDKLENIIIDFLNISKIENSKIVIKEDIDFDNIIKDLKIILNERIKSSDAKILTKIELLRGGTILKIDGEKILTILKNLVENAIIYSGDKIPEIKIEVFETKTKYFFHIKDNGIGMSEYEIEKIFERFYRIDKARTSNVAGTGLGLSIVKQLVEICEGKIDVKSKEGEGSIFSFSVKK